MKIRELFFAVPTNENGVTIFEFLKRRGFSRKIVNSLKNYGGIAVNGVAARSVDRLNSGDFVKVTIMEKPNDLMPNPDLDASVAFADDDLVIFEKPPFMPIHPSISHYKDTLGNLFAALFPDTVFRPINRLDKNTSGLCVCALNSYCASRLSGKTNKYYLAAVDGNPPDEGIISFPIKREPDSIIKRIAAPDGKPAETHYKAVLRKNGRTLLKLFLKTGRTHQIRVHLSALGFPICGDDLYGGSLSAINRQALHCCRIGFVHPITGVNVTCFSELPDDMKKLFSEDKNEN